ncbi:MAG: hypothetical protein ACRETR_12675, partial [Steroidobacteraceae bacterium]
MNDRAPPKVRRLSELPRDIQPPHDGWAALEAKLRESGVPQADAGAELRGTVPARHWRPRMMQIATLAAVLAAVVVGISIDRWILAPGQPNSPVASVAGSGSADRGVPVSYVADPRYQRERVELLRTLDARLAKLPPPTRKKVLQSLATIHQSMRDIQQALGREPGNALLQELLIDT